MKKLLLLTLLTFTLVASEISVQVLGSGGPEGGERASSSYLIKKDGKALVLIAHHAIPQMGFDGVTELHMKPSRIAEVASKSKAKVLLLSHRMDRTLGYEKPTQEIISKKYKGKIIWAEDLMEIQVVAPSKPHIQ